MRPTGACSRPHPAGAGGNGEQHCQGKQYGSQFLHIYHPFLLHKSAGGVCFARSVRGKRGKRRHSAEATADAC